jgi:muconolactone delta-isomerase
MITVADGSTDQTVDDTVALEAERARELAEQGFLLRLWLLAGERTLGLWQAPDTAQLRAILESLPRYRWMTVQTTALSHHPNDPANGSN